MIFKTFVLKTAQAKAGIWPRLVDLFQVCSKADDASRVQRILCEKAIEFKLFGNEVYYTACYLLVALMNSSKQPHCQKVLIE